ncbi:MAG TPA: cation:proton antiporter subunit C [Candidatus Binataceae bacterium]|nr:cation:proton antiporter subunit C [Candidatus Binataceae bacterium]
MSEGLYGVAAWLFMVGMYGVVTSRDLIHLVICLSVMQSSTYVLLIAIGYRTNQGAPIYADRPAGSPAVDAVVQALTFTDIVVGATVSALLLALAVQVYKHRGSIDPDQLQPMHHGQKRSTPTGANEQNQPG